MHALRNSELLHIKTRFFLPVVLHCVISVSPFFFSRLSKVLSSQLTDNNPNLADLSDMNRPTKLAEQFSELYDNEWTNAFGVLMKIEDDDFTVITKLLIILLVSFCLSS